jgi:hypothetical protein
MEDQVTTIERPYWPHSNPEPPQGPVSAQPAFTATPPQNCLNGCERATGDVREPIPCQPGQLLCKECGKRLDKWLRAIPDSYALLPSVVDHGTVPSDPGTKHTKRPHPPAPMRLEVTDLLDTRDGRGVLGAVHSWAELVRDHRHDSRPCNGVICTHARASHWADARHPGCTVIGCQCALYVATDPTVSRECAYLITNLAWCTQQDFAGDLYSEIKQLARTLNDTVGEYRPKPVGKCHALIPGELGDLDDPEPVQVLCGGALVMDREGTGVHCLTCQNRVEANDGLRALGLLVDRIFTPSQEAS